MNYIVRTILIIIKHINIFMHVMHSCGRTIQCKWPWCSKNKIPVFALVASTCRLPKWLWVKYILLPRKYPYTSFVAAGSVPCTSLYSLHLPLVFSR